MKKHIETGYGKLQKKLFKKPSKISKLIEHLKSNRTISSKEAEKRWGLQKLSARICELRKKGWKIDTEYLNTPLGEEHAVYVVKSDK